tara:strand:+ start:299 stop:508 length:210 start_codon:yes stop_codon:yes gene_type:complete
MSKKGPIEQTEDGGGCVRQITSHYRKGMHAKSTIMMKSRFDGFWFSMDETISKEVFLMLMFDHENGLPF